MSETDTILGSNANLGSGVYLPVDNMDPVEPVENEPLQLDVESIPYIPNEYEAQSPLFTVLDNGDVVKNRKENLDLDFTPQIREMFNDNVDEMIKWVTSDADTRYEDRMRYAIKGFREARENAEIRQRVLFPKEDLIEMSKQLGMTDDEYKFWQERDPRYIANQISDMQLFNMNERINQSSGGDGFFFERYRKPTTTEMQRRDALIEADAEAAYLGSRDSSFLDRAWYDLKSGVGSLGSMVVGGVAAGTKILDDFTNYGIDDTASSGGSERSTLGEIFKVAADWWGESYKDTQAYWTGKSINTGNTVSDFVRTSIFQGTPTMAGFVGMSMIPGVGIGGAAAGMGCLMGSDTYLTLREHNVNPFIAAAGAGIVGTVSFATTKFTLGNLNRFVAGRSPLAFWSARSLLEVGEEALQEVVENTTQTGVTGLARLVGDRTYNADLFFMDFKDGLFQSFEEGMMAGISTFSMRAFGLPMAARNKYRAVAFANSFKNVGSIIAKTESYVDAPSVLAADLSAMNHYHGGTNIFTSPFALAQNKISREEAVKPLEQGGLGITEEAYNKSQITGEMIAVDYGSAMVFAQKKLDAGDGNGYKAFSIDPNAMSIGEIEAEKEAQIETVERTEKEFKNLTYGNDKNIPLRLKVFRAGMRVAGFDANQSNALTALFSSGANVASERLGITRDQWLEQVNLRLEMKHVLLSSGSANVNRYIKLLDELDHVVPPAATNQQAEINNASTLIADAANTTVEQIKPVVEAIANIENSTEINQENTTVEEAFTKLEQYEQKKIDEVNAESKPVDDTPEVPLIDAVNDTSNMNARILFKDNETLLQLFSGANVSSVAHELNHLFLKDLLDTVRSGKGGERAGNNVAVLSKYTGVDLLTATDKEREEAYEKIARSWEKYLMTGIYPSPELKEPFAAFHKYITLTYSKYKNDVLGTPTPEVAAAFDQMLASDAQINKAKRLRETSEDWAHAGFSSEHVKREMDRIYLARDERRLRREHRKAGKRLFDELPESRIKIIKEDLEKQNVYKAINKAVNDGGIERETAVDIIGETAVREIEKKHGLNVFGEKVFGDIVDLGVLSESTGYHDNIDAMLSDMANTDNIDVKAGKIAQEESTLTSVQENDYESILEDTEGLDPETDTQGDMTETERDTFHEAGLAIIDEITDGGTLTGEEVDKKVSDALENWRNEQAALKDMAFDDFSKRTMRQGIDIRALITARTKARREAYKAAWKRDRQGVTISKRNEMFLTYMISNANEARILNEKAKTTYSPGGLRRIIDGHGGNAKVEFDYAVALAKLAKEYNLADSKFLQRFSDSAKDTKTLIIPQTEDSLGGFIAGLDVEPWLERFEKPKNYQSYKDLTYGQMKELSRVADWLISEGRGELKSINSQYAESIQDAVNQSIQPMERRKDLEHTGNVGGDARKWRNYPLNTLRKYVNGITLPENLFMAMDGNPTIQGKEMGFNQKLFRNMVEANARERIAFEKLTAEITPHFEQLMEERKAIEARYGGRFFSVPGVPVPGILNKGRNIGTFDFELLVSIALNMGNDANLRRLLSDSEFAVRFGIDPKKIKMSLDGTRYNFSNAQLDIIASQFSEKGWNAIQGILNVINSQYERIDAVNFNLANRHMVREKATPHYVTTSEGKRIRVEGGYFPLINDPMLSQRASQLTERKTIEDQIKSGSIENIHGSSNPEPGSLNARARDENGLPAVTLPQLLNSRIITNHLRETVHYVEMAEILRDMDRITKDSEWRRVFVNKFGQDKYSEVRTWLKETAVPQTADNSAASKMMGMLRNMATINGLALRPSTGLKQRLGYFQAANFMSDNSRTKSSGYKWMAKGIAEMGIKGNLGFLTDKVNIVNEKSAFMKGRASSFDRDIRAMRDRITPLRRDIPYTNTSWKELTDLGFAWIEINDRAGAYASWYAGYHQAIAGEANFSIEGLTDAEIEEKAVKYADTVAATQASSFDPDLTAFQRDKGIMRFFSMFMSGNVRQGSRVLQYWDAMKMGDKSKADFGLLFAREFAFPAIAYSLAAYTFKSMMYSLLGFDDDDDSNLLADIAWDSFSNTLAPFPIVREATSLKYNNAGLRMPALEYPSRIISNATSGYTQYKKGNYALMSGKWATALGSAFGIPVMNLLHDVYLDEYFGLQNSRNIRTIEEGNKRRERVERQTINAQKRLDNSVKSIEKNTARIAMLEQSITDATDSIAKFQSVIDAKIADGKKPTKTDYKRLVSSRNKLGREQVALEKERNKTQGLQERFNLLKGE